LPDSSTATGLHAEEHNPALLHHFAEPEQQRDAASLGMWVFLATEVMFFGGLFCAYLVYRRWYFRDFAAASKTINMGLRRHQHRRTHLQQFDRSPRGLGRTDRPPHAADHEPHPHDDPRSRLPRHQRHRVPGKICGASRPRRFFQFRERCQSPDIPDEYANPRHAQIFFSLYFVMTGLHALHMIIGLGIFLWLLAMAWKGRFTPEWHTPVEIGGLYWHFVDIIWIYLFPLLYLIDRHL
jgi:cytochrome c oxidase subunit 3